MNQILDYTPNGSKRSGGNKNINSDKIVRVLAIFLLIFAVLLIGIAVYSRISENAGKKDVTTEEVASDAKITADIDEETNKVIVKVAHDKIIEKVSYSWDNGRVKDVDGENKTEFELELDLSKGTHILYISVTDKEGHVSKFQQSFTSDNGKDIINPNIDISPDMIGGKAVVVITATDETEMDYITYRWNNDDEIKISVDDVEDNNNRKRIVKEVEIFEDSNDLTIYASDKAGNHAQLQKPIKGVLIPTGSIVISENKDKATVNVKHKNGISKITVRVNDGEPMELSGIDGLSDDDKKDITFDINLNDYGSGTKKIRVEAVSKDETNAVFEATVEGEDGGNNGDGNNDDGDNGGGESEVQNNEDIHISVNEIETTNENDPRQIEIVVKYENGIKDLHVKMNGVNYNVDTIDENSKEVKAGPITLPERNNKLEVTAIGTDDTQNTEVKNISF